MKTIGYVVLAVAVILSLHTPCNVGAAQIEGVQFEVAFDAGDVRLRLQGVGLFRYMGIFKAYVGAIYYEEGVSPDDLLGDKAKRLEVSYFHAIKGSDFGSATNKMIALNTDVQVLQRIEPQVAYHNSLYRDVKPGDRYALTYMPGKGTELSLNGVPLGVMEGAEFASALFAMWLGDNPMNEAFKEQLLGLK